MMTSRGRRRERALGDFYKENQRYPLGAAGHGLARYQAEINSAGEHDKADKKRAQRFDIKAGFELQVFWDQAEVRLLIFLVP